MAKIGGSRGSANGNFPKPDAGQHVAVCAAIYDIGVHYNERFDKSSQRMAIVWELETQEPDGGPFTLVDVVPVSLFKSSKMREAATALLARVVDEEEELDTDDLINKSAMLTVALSAKGSPYIDRRDALQDPSRGLSVQNSYGPTDQIHGLVAWYMRQAEADTVPAGQGVMDGEPAPRVAASPVNVDEVPF